MGTLKSGRITYNSSTRESDLNELVKTGEDLWYSSDFGAAGNIYCNSNIRARYDITANRVWNAVWNDVADFQLLNDELIYGKCYIDTVEGARICTERCQLSVIGIASDTFGFGVGQGNAGIEVPIAVAGWVLAYVDDEYPCGTPLTNDENGSLTEMTLEEKRNYPERIVAIYKKPEPKDEFGPKDQEIKVDGRHWVKVK